MCPKCAIRMHKDMREKSDHSMTEGLWTFYTWWSGIKSPFQTTEEKLGHQRESWCVNHPSPQTFSEKSMGSLSNKNQVRKRQICFNLIESDLLYYKKGQRHRQLNSLQKWWAACCFHKSQVLDKTCCFNEEKNELACFSSRYKAETIQPSQVENIVLQ